MSLKSGAEKFFNLEQNLNSLRFITAWTQIIVGFMVIVGSVLVLANFQMILGGVLLCVGLANANFGIERWRRVKTSKGPSHLEEQDELALS